MMVRNDGRSLNELRPLTITYDPFGYADTSVLLEIGGTKVLVSATLQHTVPHFLKGTRTGWLKAEYAMLPSSTRGRSARESSMHRRNSRSIEISRLIGRSLRSILNLDLLGERTIILDCDVLQADGGTRCACISAASLVLSVAVDRWFQAGLIQKKFIKESVAAVSVGIINESIYLDMSQEEDNRAHVDFNFVLTESGSIIEIQGTSEKAPMSWENFMHLKNAALLGVADIFQKDVVPPPTTGRNSLFRLGNRIEQQK